MHELTVTTGVLNKLAEAIRIAGDGAEQDTCFRFDIDEAGELRLAVDRPQRDDRVYQTGGRIVLVISDTLATQYEGKTLDVNPAGDFLLA
jgi:hypothetical protein